MVLGNVFYKAMIIVLLQNNLHCIFVQGTIFSAPINCLFSSLLEEKQFLLPFQGKYFFQHFRQYILYLNIKELFNRENVPVLPIFTISKCFCSTKSKLSGAFEIGPKLRFQISKFLEFLSDSI